MDFINIVLIAVTCLIFIIGLAGIILPVLPGIPVIWLGTLFYAFFTGFENIGFGVLVIFTVLTVFSLIIDYTANSIGAKKYGAGKWGVIGAFAGLIVGLILAGPVGLIIGPFLGAFAGELLSGKDNRQAFKAGIGSFVGFLGGILIKLVIALVMIIMFFWNVL